MKLRNITIQRIALELKGRYKDTVNRFLLKWFDPLTMSKLTCSIGDIMLMRGYEIYNRQYVVISRLLDIENYRKHNDDSFPLQNKLVPQNAEKTAEQNDAFCKLIQSFDNKGLDNSSCLIVNKDFYLLDGTHRVALMLEKEYYTVQVLRMKRKCIVPSDSLDYLNTSLTPYEFDKIWEKFLLVNQDLIRKGICFGVWIEEGNSEQVKDVIRLLQPYVHFYDVYTVENVNFTIRNFCFRNGYYVTFIPNHVDYIEEKKSICSYYVKRLHEMLNKHFFNAHYSIQMFMPYNCLEGQTIFNNIIASIVSKQDFTDFING